MYSDREPFDVRIEQINEKVAALQKKVNELNLRLDAVEGGKRILDDEYANVEITSRPSPGAGQRREKPGFGLAGKESALLPRIAAVCFMLVFALILRIVTDNEIIAVKIGSLIGMAYAAILILWGWRLYKAKAGLAPVFPICGLALLFSIVLEAHSRFASLSSLGANVIIFVAGAAVVIIALQYRAAFSLSFAALGSAAVAMTLGFPYLLFPFTALILIGANIAAYLASRRELCPSLRWTVLLLSAFFWLLWAFKLNIQPVCDEPAANLLFFDWFFPILFIFWAMYIAFSLKNILSSSLPGFYDSMLPTINVLGAYWAGWFVVETWSTQAVWLGFIAVLIGFGYLFFAAWLARINKNGAPGSNSFTFAGICIIALGLVGVVENILWVLPVWAVIAFYLSILSSKWRSGGVRVTSYLLQLVTCGVAIASGAITEVLSNQTGAMITAALLTVMSLYHYQWCRKNKPMSVDSAYFSWLDRKDLSAVALLLCGLISGFCLFRLGLHEVLAVLIVDSAAYFRGGQSVLINFGAILLMFAAVRRKSTEILLVSVIVALIGAIKVFIFDLFGIRGIPLVASVFSFGILAAVASIISGRWQKVRQG